MKTLLAILCVSFGALNAFAAESTITIVPGTNYKQTVWTAIELQRLYSANLFPANIEVARVLENLSPKHRYTCKAEHYLSSVGHFNSREERGTLIVYSLSDCQEK